MTVWPEGTCPGDALRSARLLIREKVVEHLRFRETCGRLEEAWETNNLVLLVGPSGVGKGVLIRFLLERLNAPVGSDPRILRAAAFRAPSPYSPTFPWKAFWIAWLDTLADPLSDCKVERGARRQRQVVGTVDALMRAAVSATRDRGVEVVIIDEALNLVLKERSGQTLRQRLDVLRDISDEVGCRIILVSTPRILEPLELSPELARRMREVFFPRYVFSQDMRSKDCRAFQSVVRAFVEALPEAMRPRLSSRDVQRLQSGSVGCVGNLSAWFDRALMRCVQSESKALEWSHFEATVLPDRKLIQMREDCEKGERCFKDLSVQTDEVLIRTAVPEKESSGDVAAAPSASGKGFKRRPGTPNPARHKVNVA